MTWAIEIRNIAGIRRGTATIEPGTNAVRASNWQGKSSFLAALTTVMGSGTPLTEGASEGTVSLTAPGLTRTVDLVREGGEVHRHGRPVIEDEATRVAAELFAFLDESNPIREAVRAGESLDELLLSPLDFEAIDERVAELRSEREQIEREREQAERAADRLSGLERRIEALEADLADLTDQRDAVAGEETPASDLREQLSDARAERDRVERRHSRLRETLEQHRERLAEVTEAYESLETDPEADLEAALQEARSALREDERDLELLQSVYETNSRLIDEGRVGLLAEIEHDVLDDTFACWVCGTETSAQAVETRQATIRERITTLRNAVAERRERVADLEEAREERQEAQRRERELRAERRRLRERIAEAEEDLDRAAAERDRLDERIESLTEREATADDRRVDIESTIKSKRATLADLREEREDAARVADRREGLLATRDEIDEEIETLRTRRDRIQRELRATFDEAMADLVPVFETGFESARLTPSFDLEIAREGRSTTVDALSEGEVELLGIIVCLAGFEAFDVAESVPVMLVDRLGGIAKGNVELLVDYLEGRAERLVVTAYPEHSTFDGHEIDPSDWDVVSDSMATPG